MSFILRRAALSTAFFGIGFATFARAWPSDSLEENSKKLEQQRVEIIDQIKNTANYHELISNDKFVPSTQSARVPGEHQINHVTQGLLFGPHHLEIDPIVFMNNTDHELQAYYHLGQKLTSYDGKIHNGLLSTLLDELLCFCGFPLLPSGRGVTGKLSVEFDQQAKPDTTVLLKAKVKEHRGRKVVIEGHIETVEAKPKIIARAECILVEPKWFKYFSWLSIF
jgi:acyl-coenzyme A thioesterase PaaI-like protein